ncbi:F0F1 ATP synthase assembly protein I [Methylococcaceae bacterium HT1]|nr:F0F1 ATP synthase assembly protein I [Methylococcaceae bacterium HT1]TXL18336.1 F0F1 ATP synthase assembly protein I [Methylococcaceae bacterium HT3]TXL23274.1 F0F1 ATP synthase assembly protein I [Methylococcaceae bacterium HT2]
MRKLQKLSVINKILAGQALIISLVIAGFFMLGNDLSSKSALYGGLAALIPNWYFARKTNKHKGQEAKKVVRSFYAGESGKLILTAMLFALIFQDPKVDVVAVLTTYIAALTVFWFALLIRKY